MYPSDIAQAPSTWIYRVVLDRCSRLGLRVVQQRGYHRLGGLWTLRFCAMGLVLVPPQIEAQLNLLS